MGRGRQGKAGKRPEVQARGGGCRAQEEGVRGAWPCGLRDRIKHGGVSTARTGGTGRAWEVVRFCPHMSRVTSLPSVQTEMSGTRWATWSGTR